MNTPSINGLWIPLLTPFFNGALDQDSLHTLIKKLEPYADGFVPCLATGEGEYMSNELWIEVIKFVSESTEKPIVAGILRQDVKEIKTLSEVAKAQGCVAVVIPIQEVSADSALPAILYNTETKPIKDLTILIELSQNKNIIAIKDSSRDQKFFDEMVTAKKEGKINLTILQGMENQLLASAGCDGYLIALANIEPQLCNEMFEHPSKDLNDVIMQKWDEYGLDSERYYLNLKQILAKRGEFKSPEPISP